jgi:hypothetical protein
LTFSEEKPSSRIGCCCFFQISACNPGFELHVRPFSQRSSLKFSSAASGSRRCYLPGDQSAPIPVTLGQPLAPDPNPDLREMHRFEHVARGPRDALTGGFRSAMPVIRSRIENGCGSPEQRRCLAPRRISQWLVGNGLLVGWSRHE